MRILFVIPGDIDLPTGGYRYDRSIIREMQKSGHQVELMSLLGNYPLPSVEDLTNATQRLERLPQADIAVVDDLAAGAHPEFMKKLSEKMPAVALVHHPLCLESGLDSQTADALRSSENRSLQHAKAIITTSPQTARTVQETFSVKGKPIRSILPAVTRGTPASPVSDSPIKLLCVASVIERKGHRYLIDALSKIPETDWQLDCIGETSFEPELFAELENLAKSKGLKAKIRFHGAIDPVQLEKQFTSAHIFVLASLYEGYGMVYAEAIARGLPVIGTTAGAIPDTVPEGCGILVEPKDAGQLAKALSQVISDPQTRAKLKDAAMKAADQFPTWQESSEIFVGFLEDQL